MTKIAADLSRLGCPNCGELPGDDSAVSAALAELRAENDRLTALLADAALLLRPALQSFDNGGESMRSLRSRGIEVAYSILQSHDDDAFTQRAKDFDAKQWDTLTAIEHAHFMARNPDLKAALTPDGPKL